jgi:hypothetical protein
VTSTLVCYLGSFVSNFNCKPNENSKTVGPILHYLHVKEGNAFKVLFLKKTQRPSFLEDSKQGRMMQNGKSNKLVDPFNFVLDKIFRILILFMF